MKAMTKKALAQADGVSRWTLQRWLREPSIQNQLKRFQLTKKQKKLPRGAVKIICEHYVIDID